jgi:hypothetical protein
MSEKLYGKTKYKLSKDYGVLFELIQDGFEIFGFVRIQGRRPQGRILQRVYKDPFPMEIKAARICMASDFIEAGNIGMSWCVEYEMFSEGGKTFTGFESECRHRNLEWIVPNGVMVREDRKDENFYVS